MDLTLLYIERCPKLKIANHRLKRLAIEHPNLLVSRRLVEMLDRAGSQTRLTSRCPTPGGYEGAPTLEQLGRVLADA